MLLFRLLQRHGYVSQREQNDALADNRIFPSWMVTVRGAIGVATLATITTITAIATSVILWSL